MPKQNTLRITEAQRQRVNIQKKSEKYAPSTVYLQVLGSGTLGSPNTLYLFTDQKRYLFNCGESTQRLAHEHKVKLSRLNDIFITSKSWKNLGGLPGLSLTLQDVGVPNITLHGPEGLDELYTATKRFVSMKEMNVTMANCSSTEDFEDNAMTVKYVLFSQVSELLKEKQGKKPKHPNPADKAYEEFIHDETKYYNEPGTEHSRSPPKAASPPKKVPDVRLPDGFIRKKNYNVNLHDKSNCHVAYICTLKKRLGTLDLAKCVELGVKPGPLLGQLKSGQDVCLHDGRIIRSEDVKTADDPGPVFIVLELPDISYLKEGRYFDAHYDNGKNPPEKIPSLIVHFTPPHVLNTPEYKAFMAKFGPSTQHLILNELNTCLGSEAVHRTQHKLHMLDAKIFPLLKDKSVPPMWDYAPLPPTSGEEPDRISELDELKNRIALAQFASIVTSGGSRGEPNKFADWESEGLNVAGVRSLTTYHLRPKKELDRSLEPKLRIQEYICEPMDVSGFYGALKTFLQKVKEIRGEDKPPTTTVEYPRVIFLGTGSCIPSKTRNTSGIVVQINEENAILLDCGEGTLCQLVRFFGPKKINVFLRSLKAVYISHLHADHHIGLIGVLQARRQALEEVSQETSDAAPLYLLAPGQIMSWLALYDLQFEKIRKDFSLVPNQGLLTGSTSAELTPAVLSAIGLRDVKTCLVSHCPNAFGVALYLDADHKITYSGDTIPTQELVKLGSGSDLLIHEATMEDELKMEARIKMHSTISQAVEIGRSMAAKHVILTHFSQRYARIPRLHPTLLLENENVGIAFDNMVVSMQDLPLLSHMYAPLQLMFAEHYADMELKAVNRAHKKALENNETRVRQVSAGYRESNSSRLRKQCGATETRSVVHSTMTSASKASTALARSHSLSPPAIQPVSILNLPEESGVMAPRNVRSLSSSPSRQRYLMKTSVATRQSTPASPRWKWSASNATGSAQLTTRSSPESKRKMKLLPSKIPRRISSPKKEETPSKTSAKPPETRAAQETKAVPEIKAAPDVKQVRQPSAKRVLSARSPSRPKISEINSIKNLRKPLSARRPSETIGRLTPPRSDGGLKWTTTPLPSTVAASQPLQRCPSNIKEKPSTLGTEMSSTQRNIQPSPSTAVMQVTNQSSPPPAPLKVPKSSSAPTAPTSESAPRLTSASTMRPKSVTLRSGLSKFTAPSTTDTKQSLLPREPSALNLYINQLVPNRPVDKIVSSVSANKCQENDFSEEMLSQIVRQLPESISTTSFVIATQNSSSKITMVMTTMEQQSDDDSAISRTLEITQSTTSTTSISRKDLSVSPKSLVAHRRINSIFDYDSRLNATNKSVVTKTLNMTSTTTIQKKNLSSHRSSFSNSKCYKPQLADIQSSCFLLKKAEAVVCRKPLSADEAVQQRLMEAKRKFTSREYRHQSKYDKIEGLNWISWK